MSKIIAVANQKGGVGKTTTSVNLAASLAAIGRRVLLIDLDPQGNATMGCGVNKSQVDYSVFDVLLGDSNLSSAISRVPEPPFDLLPANIDLTGAEIHLMQMDGKESRLQNALLGYDQTYDYVLIDCPPSLNLLTVNALVAADSVLVPMQCEYYALEGLSALMDTLKQIRNSVNDRLHLEGLLRTMFDGRSRLAREVAEQLDTHFEDRVFKAIVPRNIRLAEAPSYGVPALLYDKNSTGALAYMRLARELDNKIREQTQPGERL